MYNFLKLDCDMVVPVYKYTKIQWTAQLKYQFYGI